MQTATSVLLFALVFSGSQGFTQAGPTTAPPSNFPGPCRSWLFPCGKGSWVCTSEAAFWKFIFGPQPECPAVYPQTTAPPPGDCLLVNGQCQFTDSTLKCKTWLDEFNGNKCGSESEYVQLKSSDDENVAVKGFGDYPPPNQLCLPVNNSCQWYDPCLSWRDVCTNDNVCGSADEYYIHLYGPQPSCSVLPPGQIPTDPPGQCAIKKDRCDWYECTFWLSWCDVSWLCRTVYDKETYESGPPPPCPPPPPNHHPPVKPGICKFNTSSGFCSFFPNNTVAPTDCVSWIDKCGSSWLCGTVHEMEIYKTLPPFPCPLPPCPPVKPGTCRFNISDGKCSFFPNTNPCHQSVYPPGFKPSCRVLIKQWTYNPSTGRCIEFEYYPCGEDSDGYNVFSTEQECTKTCINKDG